MFIFSEMRLDLEKNVHKLAVSRIVPPPSVTLNTSPTFLNLSSLHRQCTTKASFAHASGMRGGANPHQWRWHVFQCRDGGNRDSKRMFDGMM